MKKIFTHPPQLGDVFGGLSAMLVAMPAAIAFGLVVFAPVSATQGVMAGIIGTIAIGILTPVFGGTPRLISAPCAPAAAVLATLTAEMAASAQVVTFIPTVIALVALFCGILQMLFGILGGGRLIKYVPYPVVAGYLSGVGVLILLGQLPKWFGLPKGTSLALGLQSPALWNVPSLIIGTASILAMFLAPMAPRFIARIPTVILALFGGITTYFILSLFLPELRDLAGNSLVIGSFGNTIPSSPAAAAGSHNAFLPPFLWEKGSEMLEPLRGHFTQWILIPSAMLAVLLSVDTLKTCVVLDALTRSRHDSNRELLGQGIGNTFASLCGGMPGAGTMGATLVNLSSGGKTRASGVFAGVFALIVFLLLSPLVAWVPIPALAGILIVIGFRMLDRNSLKLLKQRSTAFDFAVIASVVVAAILYNLVMAAGVGLALAILLFLREQIRGTVVRRKLKGGQIFSKKRRLPADIAILEATGNRLAVFELQGPLFFGTTDQLLSEVTPSLLQGAYLILDLKRVQSVDFTAIHLLEQIQTQMSEKGGWLLFSNVPENLPTGRDLRAYFAQVGLLGVKDRVRTFPALEDALEWVEDEILRSSAVPNFDRPLEFEEVDLFSSLSKDSQSLLKQIVSTREIKSGKKLFSAGEITSETNDELYIIRKGTVRITLPIALGKSHHLASFGRGDFFGDMAFLDKAGRSADASADEDVMVYCLSRTRFDEFAAVHPKTAASVFGKIAYVLAIRLRQTDAELRAIEEA